MPYSTELKRRGSHKLCMMKSSLKFVVFVLILISVNSRCPNNCSGHGKCQYNNACTCDSGWGASSDLADYIIYDCSGRTCPADRTWGFSLAIGAIQHQSLSECSGIGVCNRNSGRCACPPGYEGNACQRTTCPNQCSGHGYCVSMKHMALMPNALPLGTNTTSYTYGTINGTIAWDSDRIFGCVCDSTWSVGLEAGQTQEPEWFGADCSLRHCPSADDPLTTAIDETNCHNVTAAGATARGAYKNLCQVDCARRGVCDYSTGTCQCFEGRFGLDCSISLSEARGHWGDVQYVLLHGEAPSDTADGFREVSDGVKYDPLSNFVNSFSGGDGGVDQRSVTPPTDSIP